MRNHLLNVLALAGGGLLLVACPGSGSHDTDANDDATAGPDGAQDRGPPPPNPDSGLACCPAGFDLYSCQTATGGGTGFACHNPALGCASSLTCGQGCDPQVSGRCACVQTELCIVGDHFDTTLCKCVPNQDAGSVTPADAACIDNVLCIKGDHFDTSLCKCVPDTSATGCATAADCLGILPALCQQCADGGTGCAHFDCVAGTCQVAYCP